MGLLRARMRCCSDWRLLILVLFAAATPCVRCFQAIRHHHRLRIRNNLSKSTTRRPAEVSGAGDLAEVDVLYERRTALVFDARLERYVAQTEDWDTPSRQRRRRRRNPFRHVLPNLKASFLPDGVTDSYYQFVKWRVTQRFINANVHVLGTRSLLLGLGLKNKGNLGVSAALNWVLKDALGKMVRLIWASKMGRKFDSDAKRWRFRSSLLFAMGNGLEIVTFIFPSLFLLWATCANAFKQVSMLTSSSTRTALYNSFRTRENIGDITAKGEAQIAVVDLLGIASGVALSKAVGVSVAHVLGAYAILQVLEIFCIYHMIRSVQFRVLNFERVVQVINTFIQEHATPQVKSKSSIPSPTEMAKTERVFWPPDHLARRAIAFGSMGRSKLAPDELQVLTEDIFCKERFLLVVGENVKQPRRRGRDEALAIQEDVHIVLHSDATNVDIVKSTLALCLLRQKLLKRGQVGLRSRDCWEEIRQACQEADETFPRLMREMSQEGWAPPARFMFGRVSMRAEWPLLMRRPVNGSQRTTSAERRQAQKQQPW